MPTQTEIREACDIMQGLIVSPLPGPRQRAEMFQSVYRTLRKMLPKQAAGTVDELSADPEQELSADPILRHMLEQG